MRVYNFDNIGFVHITEFAQAIGMSNQSIRYLIEQGNTVRRMKFFRDRSRLMIPVAELEGYPFVQAGFASGAREIYHYQKQADNTYKRVLCEQCSYGDCPCELRSKADNLVVPEGDK